MSFLRAARAALAGRGGRGRMSAGETIIMVLVLFLALLSASCGTSSNSSSAPAANHSAYISLPDDGSILNLQITGTTGDITKGPQTPQVQGTSPTGMALLPSKQFLYVANSRANTISIFAIALDSSLALTGAPTPAGNVPNIAVIDPSGSYLLVSNNQGSNNSGGDISVYSIDTSSGALTEVAGSPYPANANPTNMVFTHSGQFLYVTNPGLGMVSAFAFCPTQFASQPQCASANGNMLTEVADSPVISGSGASDLIVDGSDRFLYVTNPSAINPPPSITLGNISGFNIGSTGALTLIEGSPFISIDGSSPSAITINPGGQLIYAMTPGTSFSIWCFSIDPQNGQLTAVTGSPFSLPGGGLFALFDPSGTYLYIGSNTGLDGYTYDQSTGAPTVVTGSPFALGASPGKMVFLE